MREYKYAAAPRITANRFNACGSTCESQLICLPGTRLRLTLTGISMSRSAKARALSNPVSRRVLVSGSMRLLLARACGGAFYGTVFCGRFLAAPDAVTVRVVVMPHHVMSNCCAPSQGADVRGGKIPDFVCELSADFGTSCDTLGSWSRFPRPLYLRPTSLKPLLCE